MERVLHGMGEGASHGGYRTGLEDAVDALERSRETFAGRAREVMVAPP